MIHKLLAIVSAVALLAALATTASARRILLSSQTTRIGFPAFTVLGPFGSTRCFLTLEGSFHSRTIEKIAGTLIGNLTRATLGACSTGAATMLTETLPWHVRYDAFTGTLPTISSLHLSIVNMAFRVREPEGVTCLIRSTSAAPATLRPARAEDGGLFGASIGGAIRTGFECLGALFELFGLSTSWYVLGTITSVRITLI